ncbi:hypothetical protein CTI12_AA202770 [Artemisia annua]|uniref:Uncharacterized protein n=1 Tax=Artemisia annua TaxID=35608 RepID=A0A2U1P1W8_ARTAN|nr:hypothetical protein CTI12_AA202770 [Artemisia annua]
MKDMGVHEYRRLVCVDGVMVANPITLKPLEEWTGRLEITLKPIPKSKLCELYKPMQDPLIKNRLDILNVDKEYKPQEIQEASLPCKSRSIGMMVFAALDFTITWMINMGVWDC